jgi:hypothetical protein
MFYCRDVEICDDNLRGYTIGYEVFFNDKSLGWNKD